MKSFVFILILFLLPILIHGDDDVVSSSSSNNVKQTDQSDDVKVEKEILGFFLYIF